jgi:AcrR family transcriptional regulator
MIAALAPDQPLAEGLQRVYDGALALYFAGPKSPPGCSLIGTVATEAARDSRVRGKLGAGLRTLTETFEARFEAAKQSGELPADAYSALLADMAGAVLHSIALRARAGDSRSALANFSRAAVKLLSG